MARTFWTPEEDNRLRELLALKTLSFNQMVVHFPGRTGSGIRGRAGKQLGLNNKGFIATKYTYNKRFFETPNPLNCYVAGFYAADGSIQDNPTTRLLAISLAPEDGHQVETFKRLFDYTGPVIVDQREHEGRCNMHTLRLYSAYELAADLERIFGLTPRKTHRLPAPLITDPHLQLCYLAGLLDGDGCVCIDKIGQISLSYVSSSRTIVEWVKAFTDSLNLYTLRPRPNVISQAGKWNAYRYYLSGYKAIDLILRIQALKKEGLPILNRKWDNERLNLFIDAYETKHGTILSPPIDFASPPPPVTSTLQPTPLPL
jgi:hypothetical protein